MLYPLSYEGWGSRRTVMRTCPKITSRGRSVVRLPLGRLPDGGQAVEASDRAHPTDGGMRQAGQFCKAGLVSIDFEALRPQLAELCRKYGIAELAKAVYAA